MSNGFHLKPLIISGFSSQPLASEIAAELGAGVVGVERRQFDDKEIKLTLLNSVRGYHVIVVASASGDPNKQEKETRLLMDAARRASARGITLLLPYMWYGRSDDIFDGRNSPALVDTIRTLSPYCDEVVIADPHNANMSREMFLSTERQIKNCTIVHFSYPWAIQLKSLVDQKVISKENLLFAHADSGGTKRTPPSFRECLYTILGYDGRNASEDDWPQGFKDRDKVTGNIKIKGFSADVTGRDVVLFEDMISSGGTACDTASFLKDLGARSVLLFATSGLFTRSIKKNEPLTAAVKRINKSKLDAVFISDTYSHQLTDPKIHRALDQSPVIHTVKTAPYLAGILRALQIEVDEKTLENENSISALSKGMHPDQINGTRVLARPVFLKRSNPLLQLKKEGGLGL